MGRKQTLGLYREWVVSRRKQVREVSCSPGFEPCIAAHQDQFSPGCWLTQMRFDSRSILFGEATNNLRDAAALARPSKSEGTFDWGRVRHMTFVA